MKSMKSISSFFTVISLLLGVIWLSPVSAAVPAFSSLGQITAEALQVPGAMDIDEAGNLYVVDTYAGGKVHKFDRYGNFAQSFDVGASGAGLAVKPGSPGVPSGLLYVSREQSVVIFDVNVGAVVGEFVGADSATMVMNAGEIDVDENGNVFVVDASQMSINVFDADGVYQSSFGSVGPDPGQFMQVGGMAVNPIGQVVVADSSYANGKVHVFTLNPDLSVSSVVAYSKGSAQNFGSPIMHAPRGIAFDAQGRGFFLDFMSSQVRVTDAGFNYLGAYTTTGYAVGQLNNVIDAVYDTENDRLFVGCDTGRIEVFGVDGGSNPVDVNHAPSVPQPKSPVAGGEAASVTPTLVINNATDVDGDALTYHVVVSHGGDVVNEIDAPATAGDTTSVVVGVALAENVAYSWTVQASDGDKSSAVSTAADFVVNATEEAPSVPELIAPVDGDVVNGLDALSWGGSVDPDPNDNNITYTVEVAADGLFDQIVASAALTETALVIGDFASYGDLVDGNSYFWRVVAKDDSQMASDPSSAGQFVYDTSILTVKANMPDATVSFHGNHAYAGQSAGVAPLELRDVTSGKMSVVVERAGFEKFVTQVELAERDNVEVYAELRSAKIVDKLAPSRNGINGRSGLTVSEHAAPFLVDFDNDGDLDLLVGDAAGQVSIFANMTATGRNEFSFDPGVTVVDGLTGAVPFAADWNNDGRKDLIVGQASGVVTLFINSGLEEEPAFADGIDLFAGSSAIYVGSNAAPAVMDYNGDGAKDLIVGNSAGQVAVYFNQDSGAAPVLAATPKILPVSGSVPFPVDWNEDGQKDLLVSGNGVVTVYLRAGDKYQAGPQFSEKRAELFAAFPIDVDGSGKALFAGQSDGQLVYLSSNANEPVDSFFTALQDKAAELVDLVAVDAPEFNDDATAIAAMVSVGDYEAARDSVKLLEAKLPVGDAKVSAQELYSLL